MELQICNRRTALGVLGSAAIGALLPRRALANIEPITPGSWTIAVLPDTQHYCRRWPQHFDAQTTWIAEHAKSHNIKFVLHEGDVTHNNNVPQWDNALRSMSILNGVVPYAMSTGNHDYGVEGESAYRYSFFNEPRYFGPGSAYAKQPTVGEFFERDRTDNSFHTFSDGQRDWLIIALGWAPRNAAVDWANKVVEAHPNHLAMLVTHAYMYNDDTRYDWATRSTGQTWNPHAHPVAKEPNESVNDGEELWEKLVAPYKNFRFAFNGHVLGDGTGFLSSKGQGGNVVHQMLANYQFKHEGGDADMRLLEFHNNGNDVTVRTYSPSLDRYDKSPDQQFALKMDTRYVMPQMPAKKKRQPAKSAAKAKA